MAAGERMSRAENRSAGWKKELVKIQTEEIFEPCEIRPLVLADTEVGAREVEYLLGRLEYGLLS